MGLWLDCFTAIMSGLATSHKLQNSNIRYIFNFNYTNHSRAVLIAEENFSLVFSVAESFHKHPMEIDLTQACVGELNTILRGDINWPIIYGVGVNIRTGEIFPASFPDKGPDIPLRQARNFTGGQNVSARRARSRLERWNEFSEMKWYYKIGYFFRYWLAWNRF